MLKSLGIVIGGIFVGAVGMEIVHRKYPDALDKLCKKSSDLAAGIKEGFRKGYANATGKKVVSLASPPPSLQAPQNIEPGNSGS